MKIYMHALHGVLGIVAICSAWFLDIRMSTCFYSVASYIAMVCSDEMHA